jgi:hypothetical protein
MAQDENGNWVQLDPNEQAQVAQQQAQIAQAQQYAQPAPPAQIIVKKNGLGFWAGLVFLEHLAWSDGLSYTFTLGEATNVQHSRNQS